MLNSFLNMPNFAQAFAILLWSSVSCRFLRFTTLQKYAAVSSFYKISTLIRQHFASFAPTPYPILLCWIFVLFGWIFRPTFAASRSRSASIVLICDNDHAIRRISSACLRFVLNSSSMDLPI